LTVLPPPVDVVVPLQSPTIDRPVNCHRWWRRHTPRWSFWSWSSPR